MIGMVGAGRVGAQAAVELSSQGVDDIALVAIVDGLAEGEALDISHKISETGVDVSVAGPNAPSSQCRGGAADRGPAQIGRPGWRGRALIAEDAGALDSGRRECGRTGRGRVVSTC